MLVYWSIVLVPALLSLTQSGHQSRASQVLPVRILFFGLFIFLALRATGGDYPTYLQLYEILQDRDIESATETIEPLYGLLNWLSAQLDLRIYGVNAVCALIFLYCLHRAAVKERHPFFLATLAVPYFVIVVGMGYTRQSVAAALVFLSVVQLREGRALRACVSILVATGFHFSAFAALCLPVFVLTRRETGFRWVVSRAVLIAMIAYGIRHLLKDQIDAYATNYIESDRYRSGGAFLRSLVTAAASLMYFAKRRDFRQIYDDYSIWRPFALLGLASVPLSLFASTPVDRMGLYLIPFQLVIFCRLPTIINGGRSFGRVKALIIVGYMVYFFTWLHLGSYAEELWLPYRWIFSDDLT
jgi:hypothetical protein